MFTLASNDGALVLTDGSARLRLVFVTAAIARVTFTAGRDFVDRPSLMVTATSRFRNYTVRETGDAFEVSTPELRLVVSKATGAISYFAGGELLLHEPPRGGKALTPKKVFRNVFQQGGAVASGTSIDGARAAAAEFATVFDRTAFEAELSFQFAPNEAIFGLGSHEEGYGNLRGQTRLLYQQNMKIVVPCFVSTRGYGVLLDCGSLMTFRDGPDGACWWADVVDELDYYFTAGSSFDAVTRNLHVLTGPAPLLPRWAFGFAQSKERYVNAQELIDVVREYRRRRIPLDLIVLDWKSWPNGAGWGQKEFDPRRFPDPAALTRELHALGARLMVSIWPIMTGDCTNQRELAERGLMLGNQSTYDAFSPEARQVYWRQAERGLFAHGVDAWWCDCTEPFEADWSGATKPEPATRLRLNTDAAKQYLDPGQISTYSLPHSRGIYEGQRRVTAEKRVVNLTRSGYAGQHRFATICWNGDISATWETLRRCIPEGLNFCATGEPYWTVDIGGFFINRDPKLWFWQGDYAAGCRGLTDMNAHEPDPRDTGCTDLGFHELYTRWVQYAAFLPMFRSHGTDAAREIWRFGEAGNPFYDAIARYIRLRYQVLPYIYSLAAQVTRAGSSLMRHVALEFPRDPATHGLTDQFLFGTALLVCPVTSPMYYGPGSDPLLNVEKCRNVYLPAGGAWFDFWTGQRHEGGQTIRCAAPLETLPLFVRAGTLLPLGPDVQFAAEKPADPIELRVYAGADGELSLYEDEGDSYRYEQGASALIPISWNDRSQTLTFGARQGNFPGMLQERTFRIVVVAPATGPSPAPRAQEVRYTGAGPLKLRCPAAHSPDC